MSNKKIVESPTPESSPFLYYGDNYSVVNLLFFTENFDPRLINTIKNKHKQSFSPVYFQASRNYEVSTSTGIFAEIIKKYDLDSRMSPGSVIQGEIFGESIQKNPLKMKGHHLAVFHHNNIGDDDYLTWLHDEMLVPIYQGIEFPETIQHAVEQVDGLKSLVNPQVQAEGIVWWNKEEIIYPELGDRANFKAINNKFLLKQK